MASPMPVFLFDEPMPEFLFDGVDWEGLNQKRRGLVERENMRTAESEGIVRGALDSPAADGD